MNSKTIYDDKFYDNNFAYFVKINVNKENDTIYNTTFKHYSSKLVVSGNKNCGNTGHNLISKYEMKFDKDPSLDDVVNKIKEIKKNNKIINNL